MAISGFTAGEEVGAGQGVQIPVWTPGVVLALGLGYTAGFALAALAAGFWQATRDFAVEALILFLWLAVAGRLLKGQAALPAPGHNPRFELLLGLGATALLVAGAALFYLGFSWAIIVNLALIYGLPLLVLAKQPDRRRAFGLDWPSRRGWLVLFAIIAINLLVGIVLGNLLPPGELPTPPGADLTESLTGPLQVLLAIGQLALIAAIPEELFFRVYLQPRLGRFLPVGLAILVQALLFSAAHLPLGLIRYGEPLPLALAGLCTVANGVIGGYLWYRTRSLPLLILLHLFAYPRIAL